MKIGIEKCALVIRKNGKSAVGIELSNQECIVTVGIKSKWEYWKRTSSNKWR